MAIDGIGCIGAIVALQFIAHCPKSIGLVAATDLFPPEGITNLTKLGSVHDDLPFELESGSDLLQHIEDELTLVEIVTDARSSMIGAPSIKVVGGRTAEMFAWYDNDRGLSFRMLDLASHIAMRGGLNDASVQEGMVLT